MPGWIENLYRMGVSHNVFSVPLPDGTYYPTHISQLDDRPEEFLTHFNRSREKE